MKTRSEMSLIDSLIWICDSCGVVRPDAKISVYKKLLVCHGDEIQFNMKYCNDNVKCLSGIISRIKELGG